MEGDTIAEIGAAKSCSLLLMMIALPSVMDSSHILLITHFSCFTGSTLIKHSIPYFSDFLSFFYLWIMALIHRKEYLFARDGVGGRSELSPAR